mmetsp:Transcript_1543/g.4682  ORF Transcript_1543/g.4682 Transcript_1543/m.4682 type:complete len:207 (-) Transcript_1543:353-973(-)
MAKPFQRAATLRAAEALRRQRAQARQKVGLARAREGPPVVDERSRFAAGPVDESGEIETSAAPRTETPQKRAASDRSVGPTRAATDAGKGGARLSGLTMSVMSGFQAKAAVPKPVMIVPETKPRRFGKTRHPAIIGAVYPTPCPTPNTAPCASTNCQHRVARDASRKLEATISPPTNAASGADTSVASHAPSGMITDDVRSVNGIE